MTQEHFFIQDALKTIEIEIEGLHALKSCVNDQFSAACETILACKGRVVVIGMGKSGHIASKIAATLASTGTPAFFVHPAEAGHGDLGMITKSDVVIAISNSGATHELTILLPMIRRLAVPLIAISSKPNSPLAQAANITLNLGITKEACPHNLAPTSSTTATLVMGDALAIALLNARKFTPEDFAYSHPSGALGKRLTLTVSDLMKTGSALPIASPSDSLQDVILEMTSKGLGMCLLAEKDLLLKGVFTDGDLRRIFQQSLHDKDLVVAELMNRSPKIISHTALAVEALNLMNQFKITTLVTLDDKEHIAGVIHMHDLIREGIA